MAELNLPNIRKGGDITFRVGLEDGGVAVDWSAMEEKRAFLFSDEQRLVSGECTVAVDPEDSTVLVCQYSGDDRQYAGVNSVVVRAKYRGRLKVYDKKAVNIVGRTSAATGVVVIEDPVVPVQLSVEDVSTTLLENAIAAAIDAAARATAAAEAAEHMVDIHTGPHGPAGKSPYIDETTGHWFIYDDETGEYVDSGNQAQGETGNGIASWSVVESQEDGGSNVVTVTFTDGTSETFTYKNGHTGATPAISIGTVETGEPGTPAAATMTGTTAAPILNLTIPKGQKGDQGNTGSSVEYPFELVNNETTDDATKAHSAAGGKRLKDELTQLEAKVDDLQTGKYYGYFAKEEDLPEADVDGFAYVGEGPTYTIYNLRDGVWTSSEITVNQSPIGNDEDIDQNEDGKLQFANRVYNAQQPNGMGYKILRKDATFASQVTDTNTIYEIRYSFNLNGATVTVPDGCVLKFVGGKLSNGTLSGNHTLIDYASGQAFDTNITLSGTFDTELNPIMFGILSADKNTAFGVLDATHKNANAIGGDVNYSGIKEIAVNIAGDEQSIPVEKSVNFCGCRFIVENTTIYSISLFTMHNPNTLTDISISKAELDSVNFSGNADLPSDPCLLITTDETALAPRVGHQQVYMRNDIAFLVNKNASNLPIFTYNTADSIPVCKYILVDAKEKVFKDVCFERKAGNTAKVFLCKCENNYNVKIENIKINTPSSTLTGDRVIYVENCVKVSIDNVVIDGTYSTASVYGYGIEVYNCADLTLANISGRPMWHIFASQSLNGCVVRSCQLETFDCHAYGANFLIDSCTFSRQLQMGYGIFGDVILTNCQFNGSISGVAKILSANTGLSFKLSVNNCDVKQEANGFLFQFTYTAPDERGRRTDIVWNNIPNVYVDGLNIKPEAENINTFIVYTSSSANASFSNTPEIVLSKIRSEKIARLSFKRYNTITFPRLPKLAIRDSVLDNILIQYASVGVQSNTDETLSELVYENCVVDFSTTDRLARMTRAYYPIRFIGCEIVNCTVPTNAPKNSVFFIDCRVAVQDRALATVTVFPGMYCRCSFDCPSNKPIAVPTTGTSFFELRDSRNILPGTQLLYLVSSYLPLSYSLKYMDSKYCLTKPIYATTAPTLDSSIRGVWVDLTENKAKLWNGSAFVNMDGTALS